MRPLEMVLVHSERAPSGQRSIKIQTPSAFYNSISPLSSFHSSQRVLLSSQLNISNHLMHFKEAFRLRNKNVKAADIDFGQRFIVWSLLSLPATTTAAETVKVTGAKKRKLKLDLCNDKTLPSERSWCILLREVHQPAVANKIELGKKWDISPSQVDDNIVSHKLKNMFSLSFHASCISGFHPIDHEKMAPLALSRTILEEFSTTV